LDGEESTDMPYPAQEAVSQPTGIYRFLGHNDEAMTSFIYMDTLRAAFEEIYKSSSFWHSKMRFAEARRRLSTTVSLEHDWDTYGAESPNDLARTLAAKVLDVLEEGSLPPSRLIPSAEGGIAMSFVAGDNRGEIEIYNSGEIAAAIYSGQTEPTVWELKNSDIALKNAIAQIRVHLAA
jgi:hypothetical protein